MRLWVKFLSILAVAIALQAWLDTNARWLDDTWFAVRVGLHNLVPGADPNDASMMAAADALSTRQDARSPRACGAAAAAGIEPTAANHHGSPCPKSPPATTVHGQVASGGRPEPTTPALPVHGCRRGMGG